MQSHKNIFIINKPKNVTSNQLIQYIKKRTNIKKIGHGGTLDPLATGVLIIGVNHGTKLLNHHLNDQKTYIATIEFGYSTDTYDIDGKIINHSTNFPNDEQIKYACNHFLNNQYFQTVPLYSAVKINGKELYKYARSNEHVENLPTKLVQIFSYHILEYNNHILKIVLEVSKGFYIRSFVNDLANYLQTCACLIELERIKSGNYELKNAFNVDDFIQWWNLNKN